MDAATSSRVVIVGAGHGGANAAALLRQQGYPGEIVLLSAEETLPYQRPPLSKDFLKAELPASELLIKPEAFWVEQAIDLRLGSTATAIDTTGKRVELAEGDSLSYDTLILSTGAEARKLDVPGGGLGEVCELRTRADADRLAAHLRPGSRVVIVGGGYVGLEVAASARHLGAWPVVLEREERVLARVASSELADWLSRHHVAQGTQIITSADVAEFVDRGDGTVGSVRLADGRLFDCDVALVGVGAVPCEGIASAAGLACEGGIVVDDNAWTGVDSVYAVGDVTRRPLAHYEGAQRLESIPSAVEQAKQAVHAILGKPTPRPELPWFWSDQFDVKVKIAGLLRDVETTVLRGDPQSARFALYHCSRGRVVAVEAVNSSSDFMAGKHLIERRVDVDLTKLADDSVSLRDLAA